MLSTICAASFLFVACKSVDIAIDHPIQLYRGYNGKICRATADAAARENKAPEEAAKVVKKFVDNKKMKGLHCIDANDPEFRKYYAISGEDLAQLYELIAKLKQKIKYTR